METTPAEKYRILLVEDERPVREIARLMIAICRARSSDRYRWQRSRCDV